MPLSKPEKSRTLLVGVVAIVLLVVVTLLRPVEEHGLPYANFWEIKFSDEGNYDIVAAGDSRVLHGLSMEPFEEFIAGRAFNFGFRGSAFTEDYLAAAAKHLSVDGERVLVLGITPNGFTEFAKHSNGYDQKVKEYGQRKFKTPYWMGLAEQRLQPMTIGEAYRTVSGRQNPLQLTFHEDGWVESSHANPNEDHLLKFYSVHFNNNLATAENVDTTLKQIQQFVSEGIRVIAYRPPLSQSVQDAEDKNSDFDYGNFAEEFTKVGGVWIEVDPTKYQTYDGSHLSHESAREFSKWLASEIKNQLKLASGADES